MMAETTNLVPLLGVGAWVAGVLIARLPVATCAECPHCRAAALHDAAEQRELRKEYERRFRIPPRIWGRGDEQDDDDGDRR